MGRAKVRLSHM